MDVRREAFHQIITLNSCNRWKEILEHLPVGVYELRELNATHDVSCIINRGEEAESAVTSAEAENVDVKMINKEKQLYEGSIELCKLIRDAEGCYRYPPEQDSFWTCIKGEEETSRILLSYANHFYASPRNLKDGWYEITEESRQEGVRYVVDNAAPLARGIVHIMQSANTVNIINPQGTGNTGNITLSKYVEDTQGLLSEPQSGSYRVHVSSPDYNETFALSSRNGFTETIGLLPSTIYVIDELDHEDVGYVIDGGSQVDRVIVAVNGTAHQAQVINREQVAESGSTTMVRHICQDGMLMRPQKDTSYVFLVSGPSYNELVTLDVFNRQMHMLSGLVAGDYVTSETTTMDAVSFIINGGNEMDCGIINMAGTNDTVQAIDAPQASGGDGIQLGKCMCRNQNLVRPDGGFVPTIHILRPGYNEVLTSNRESNWSLLIDTLEDGIYIVDEVDDHYDVSYIVNGASKTNSAIVNVEGSVSTVQTINTVKEVFDGIRIEKFIWVNSKPEQPVQNFVTRVHALEPGYNEVFTLNAASHWSILIKDLMGGWYVIDEVDSDDQVAYIINGGSEVVNGIVYAEKNSNEVAMIDAAGGSGSSITLSRLIRNASGRLVLSDGTQHFAAAVGGAGMQASVVLQKSNNWEATLRDLAAGTYQISEQKPGGYEVACIVDDMQESSTATVEVGRDAHNVSIINAQRNSYGKLRITKFIRQANGTLTHPADDDQYIVEVCNMTTVRRMELNFGNSFAYAVDDLPKGTCSIREINNDQFIITYWINEGTETNSATIVMGDAVGNVVEVINELIVNRNTIEVLKYMPDDDGNYLPPSAPNTFRFRIRGKGIDQVYDLNVDNGWHQSLATYPDGVYEVQELDSPCPVQYLVSSPKLVDETKFTVLPGTTVVVSTINRTNDVQNGSMELTKRAHNAQEGLQRPADSQSCVMRVSSDSFNRLVMLDRDNDFTALLESLPYETYQIQKTSGNGSVSFLINNETETTWSILEVISDTRNEATIINTETQAFYRSNVMNTVKIVVE